MTCQEIVSPRYGSVATRGKGYKPCGVARRAEANRTSELVAVATTEAAGLDPLVPFPGPTTRGNVRCMICTLESELARYDSGSRKPTTLMARLRVTQGT